MPAYRAKKSFLKSVNQSTFRLGIMKEIRKNLCSEERQAKTRKYIKELKKCSECAAAINRYAGARAIFSYRCPNLLPYLLLGTRH